MNECLPLLLKDLETTKTCLQHGKPVEFWCTNTNCLKKNNFAVCTQCLKQHMHHTHMMVNEKQMRAALSEYTAATQKVHQ